MNEEEIKGLQEDVERLKKEKEGLASELAVKSSRVMELEQSSSAREAETAVLRQNVTDLKAEVGSVSDSLKQAVASYRTLASKANPETLVEMIVGETIEAIDDSVRNAQALVGKVREKLEAAKMKTRIPAGAPQRTPADLSAMTSREKIQHGINRK